MLHKSKEKTVGTYLKLIDSLVKPIILYACECWGDSLKRDYFANKIEKFHVSMYKQILGVKQNVSNMKVLAELGRTPLKNNIETQMFKYLQRFAFTQKDRYVFKTFEEESLIPNGWVAHLKTKLDLLGLGNLIINIFKVVSGDISKENYQSKHNFFQKRVRDFYIQSEFYSYVDNSENKSFFTEIKQTYDMERYLNLKNFEIRRAISRLRLSSHKLAIVTGKWYKIEKENRHCKFCPLGSIEDEFHFLLNCDSFSELRKSTLQEIKESENIDLSKGNPIKKLRDLFSQGLLHSLHVLGKFIKVSLEDREKST